MIIYLLIGLSIFLVGISVTVYQIVKIVEIDAITRNIKKPKLWSFLAISGQNCSGLITYLIYRNKYKIVKKTSEQSLEMNKRKNIVGISISFMAIGAILIYIYILYN